MRPAAHHSRTGSVLSEWADSEGLGPPDVLELCSLHAWADSEGLDPPDVLELCLLLCLGTFAGNSGAEGDVMVVPAGEAKQQAAGGILEVRAPASLG